MTLLATSALLLAACGDATPGGATAPSGPALADGDVPSGGELVVALAVDPTVIDPVNAPSVVEGNVAWQMFDSLVWINDDGELEPSLAESWTVSDDGLTYTFELRQGVTFHNGEEFDAEAVKRTWEIGKNPENAYFDAFELASDVTVVDADTVEITSADANALFLVQVGAGWPIVAPDYYDEVGLEGFSSAPVGTGPFAFVSWDRGDRIVLEKFDDYWREGYPKLDRIVFRPITESSTAAAAIRTGDVDIVQRLSPTDARTLETVDGVELVEYANNRVYYISFNNLTTGQGEPTEDAKVRQAMNYAVDKQGIIDALFDGKGQVPSALMASSDIGYDPAIEPYPYDPAMAEELLADAGYPDGFTIGMSCPTDAYTSFLEVCEAVVAQLAEVGITAELDAMESGAFWELQAEKQLPPLFGDSWSANTNEASAYDRLFGALGGDDASFSAWSDPVVDDLLAEIRSTQDPTERLDVWGRMHRQLHDDPPFIYLYEPVTVEATTSRVVNYNPRNAEDYWLWNVGVTS